MLAKWKGFFFFFILSLYSLLVIMTLSSSHFLALHGWHVLGSALAVVLCWVLLWKLGSALAYFYKCFKNHPCIAGYLGNTIVPLFLNFNKAAISFLFYSLLSLQDQGVNLWD